MLVVKRGVNSDSTFIEKLFFFNHGKILYESPSCILFVFLRNTF